MGICLDTDQRNDRDAEEYEYGQYQQYGQYGRGQRGTGGVAGRGPTQAWQEPEGPSPADHYPITPPEGQFPMQNGGHIKFEVPKVPVIFVLGGPGSGKVTHCDNLMQERRGVTHINMTDLLQQYSVGNEMQDFAQLSSKTVTEVLMLEMKMAPAAKTYLVSGYPRSMRDVVEYSNKIQIVNGVILVAWRQKVLERQVEYGAKLGHVVLSLARMELDNFYRNVMPVADFFDQRQMLVAVNGERDPNEVYADFRAAVLHILGTDMTSALQPPAHGEWPAPSMDPSALPPSVPVPAMPPAVVPVGPPAGAAPLVAAGAVFPPVIWVIGGPGSNKSSLCQKAVRQAPGWAHVSVGRLLRQVAENTEPRQAPRQAQRQGGDAHLIRQSISNGEMVPPADVLQLVEAQLAANIRAQGVLIDGFPRDMSQVLDFESKFKQQPPVLLLDCSKLQLGRGRLDDTVAAFRRRLELFRELTLPMLRTMDQENRLTIVDGDTDSKQVQDEFYRAVQGHMESLRLSPSGGGDRMLQGVQGLLPRAEMQYDTMLHDLEAEDDPAPAQMANGPRRTAGGRPIANGVALGVNAMNVNAMHGPAGGANNGSLFGGAVNPPGRTRVPVHVLNGGYAQPRPSRDTIRHMYADVEAYPVDSHM